MTKVLQPLDQDVKIWFFKMCEDFVALRFKITIQDHSVAFDFPEEWHGFFGNKQPTTLQYVGLKKNQFEAVAVRFYVEPLTRASLWELVKHGKPYSNEPNSYRECKLYEEYDYNRLIKPILVQMEKVLCANPATRFSELPVVQVPLKVYELPK